MSVEPSPQRDAGTIVGLPHHRDVLLEIPFLVGIVGVADVVLGDVHWNLQSVLDFGHYGFERRLVDTTEVVTLTAIGVDGCSGIAQGSYEVDELVGIPLEGVEVIID